MPDVTDIVIYMDDKYRQGCTHGDCWYREQQESGERRGEQRASGKQGSYLTDKPGTDQSKAADRKFKAAEYGWQLVRPAIGNFPAQMSADAQSKHEYRDDDGHGFEVDAKPCEQQALPHYLVAQCGGTRDEKQDMQETCKTLLKRLIDGRYNGSA